MKNFATDLLFSLSLLVASAAEQNNTENLLAFQDAALAKKYIANWQAHLQHSE